MSNNDLPPVFRHLADLNISNEGPSSIINNTNKFSNNPVADNLISSASTHTSLTWSLLQPAGEIPPARSGAASVIVDGKLYIFGGYGGGTGRLDDFYSFDFERNKWKRVEVLSEERPGFRENNGVVASGDSRRLTLFGGYDGNQWLNDLWVFDIPQSRWTCIQESSDPNDTSGPSRRFGYVSVVHRNKFVLFGGFDGVQWLNDRWEFNFDTRVWRLVQARGELPSARSCPAWAQDDSHVYIIGGYDGIERKSDFFACDLATYKWRVIPPMGTPPSPRYFHSCCLYANKIIVYGGFSGSQRLDDMYLYDFDSKEWSQIDCNNGYGDGGTAHCPPSGRSSLVAQVYKNFLYVFGGYNGDTVLNDFYKFRLQSTSILLPTLFNDMRRLINNPELSDCTFLVEGHEVHANRSILAVRSHYFHALLFGSTMRESIQTEEDVAAGISATERRPVEINGVSYAVFMKVLEFLYTDSIRNLDTELGIQVLFTSELFMLDRLKALCEDIVRRDLSVDNVCDIVIASHRNGAGGLEEIALDFIVQHLAHPTIIESIVDLKSEPDLLVEIIRRKTQLQGATPSSPFRGWSGTRR
jgi:N-acetylneuraminic acid mutarotase